MLILILVIAWFIIYYVNHTVKVRKHNNRIDRLERHEAFINELLKTKNKEDK
jgi:hypothetical protein